MCSPRSRARDSSSLERRVQKRGRHAARLQRIDLILHQRNQRRNHDRESARAAGGQLKAERFAAAGRQQREDIAARQRVADDFLLQRPERVVAEMLF